MPPESDNDVQAGIREYVRVMRDEDIAKANLYHTVDNCDGEALTTYWDNYVEARKAATEADEPTTADTEPALVTPPASAVEAQQTDSAGAGQSSAPQPEPATDSGERIRQLEAELAAARANA